MRLRSSLIWIALLAVVAVGVIALEDGRQEAGVRRYGTRVLRLSGPISRGQDVRQGANAVRARVECAMLLRKLRITFPANTGVSHDGWCAVRGHH